MLFLQIVKKYILYAALLSAALFAAFNGSLLSYAVHLGWGQLKIICCAKPVSYWMENKSFPDSLKNKLKLIEEIRRFGIDSLGLKDADNYKKLYNQEGQEIMWVVQACEAFDLKPVQWHFPVVGDMPYKGFFEKKKALREAGNWEEKGFDVSIQNPAGWSTLGWFSDPILSNMLWASEGELANLILHEMVHSAIFIANKTEWNENLATFLGDASAYLFLNYKFGKNSKEYQNYFYEELDAQKRIAHAMRGARKLDSLYRTFSTSDSLSWKKEKKRMLIKEIMERRDTLGLHYLRPYAKLPNNVYFMSYRLYHDKQQDFKRECETLFAGDIKKYIQHWKEKSAGG